MKTHFTSRKVANRYFRRYFPGSYRERCAALDTKSYAYFPYDVYMIGGKRFFDNGQLYGGVNVINLVPMTA